MVCFSKLVGLASISKLALLLAAGAEALSTPAAGFDKRKVDINNLESLGNNTLFEKWRPRYHFAAPAGWMNDPCGAMYDPTRDEYHLMYQWYPNHVMWGNMSWGHAVSKDLITWTDIHGWKDGSSQALVGNLNGAPYDKLGIFSGTAQPVNLKGEQDGTLLMFYTAISALPTNWKLPYIPGTEKQAFATSKDGGKSWQRYEKNPVIPAPPAGWNITGWRDPFFKPFPELDTLLNLKEPHFYLVLGSGIKNVGPRMPLYSAPCSDLTQWTFIGALWEPGMNETFATDGVEISGSQGFNFEVVGFYTLPGEVNGTERYFTNFGAEGGSVEGHDRWSLWNEGKVTATENGAVLYEPIAAGVSDCGNLYAMTSFLDKKHNDRRVQWGWSQDELNGNLPLSRAIGYNGALGLPRELFVKTIHGVVDTEDKYLSKKGPFIVLVNESKERHRKNTLTASTKGFRPLPEVVRILRKTAIGAYTFSYGERKSGVAEMLKDEYGNVIQSDRFSLSTTISRVGKAVSELGFVVRASPDGEEQTKIIYHPQKHRIEVHREQSSQLVAKKILGSTTVWGHFRPLILARTNEEEDINVEIFVDGSLIEIFVNDRFAATTRVYPWREDSLGIGLWTGLGEKVGKNNLGGGLVWPKRPVNSSSKLVWDSPDRSGNGTWWAGY
ncbi:Arabinanase/levansucrase/invertase [Terfezia boudieri ATCC MYA-4762]|uniref:Arabinanase/levansucrase/invertase n=1 Tax=Terfezia boudieri ATCC MYA-4762 TaxID=1051890 RepID=A0A3N4LB91_9PEZI|nr:Arabinanase/levansucrase/invertase [Terfezia boudieri ATCC MYA-4762]